VDVMLREDLHGGSRRRPGRRVTNHPRQQIRSEGFGPSEHRSCRLRQQVFPGPNPRVVGMAREQLPDERWGPHRRESSQVRREPGRHPTARRRKTNSRGCLNRALATGGQTPTGFSRSLATVRDCRCGAGSRRTRSPHPAPNRHRWRDTSSPMQSWAVRAPPRRKRTCEMHGSARCRAECRRQRDAPAGTKAGRFEMSS